LSELTVSVDDDTSDARKVDYVARSHHLCVHIAQVPGTEDESD